MKALLICILVLISAPVHARSIQDPESIQCGIESIGIVNPDRDEWGKLFCEVTYLDRGDRTKIVLIDEEWRSTYFLNGGSWCLVVTRNFEGCGR